MAPFGTISKDSRAAAYYELSAARSRSDNKKSVVRDRATEVRDAEEDRDDQELIQPHARPDSLVLRADRCEHRATALREESGLQTEDGAISKTQAWTVSYDE